MKSFLIKIILIITSLSVFLLLIIQTINYNKIAFGLKIANLNIGGRNISYAEATLLQYFSELQDKEILLKYENQIYSVTPIELGVTLKPTESLDSAILIGHKKNIFLGLIEQIMALFGKYDLEADFSLDETKLNNFIVQNLSEIEKPAQNASLVFNKEINDFEIVASREGIIIDRKKFKNDLRKIGYTSSIFLSLIEDKPEIEDTETDQAKNSALNILKNAPYILILDENSWSVDKEKLIDWVEFKENNETLAVSLDSERVKQYLSEIAVSVNQEPINAQLVIRANKADIFSLAKKGIELNIDKNAKKITKEILNGFTLRSFSEGGQKIILETDEIEPTVSTNDDTNNLGLTSLLGKGESSFAGSPKNRIHNIKIGSSKMNGVILKPGEEFSFNNFLGEVGPEQGYLAELTIKRNKTTPEYGGGLCQVSTTIFRAAVNSGLKITERYPHAFPVKYYNPQGFDATIYPPHPDLRFVNDTPNHLLIQSRIKGSQLTFEIYGTDDDRKVKVIGPIVYDQQPDGSMKATLTQEIWRNNELERKSVFKSNYKSPDLYPIERNPLE